MYSNVTEITHPSKPPKVDHSHRPLVESSCEERNYRQLDQVQHPSYSLFAIRYSQWRGCMGSAEVTSCNMHPRCLLKKLVNQRGVFNVFFSVSGNGSARNLPPPVVMFHAEFRKREWLCPEIGGQKQLCFIYFHLSSWRKSMENGVFQWTKWHLHGVPR